MAYYGNKVVRLHPVCLQITITFFERDLGVEKVTKFFTSLPAFSGRRMLQTARQTHQTPFVLQDPSSFDFLILNITYQKK
ncbi:MAG: hypothetical protein AB1633_11805, partial [Elusimicrobiota bacterium]